METVLCRDTLDILPKIFRYRLHRLKRGQIIVVVGNKDALMGNGKTAFAISLARLLDEQKWDESKIEYSLLGFLNLVDRLRIDTFVNKKPYQVAILDEGQVAIPNDEWYTASSKAIFEVATVFRKAKHTAIIITPDMGFILKKIRFLINWVCVPSVKYNYETRSIEGTVKIFRLTHNINTGDITWIPIQYFDLNNKRAYKAKKFKFYLPPSELMKKIEEKENIAKAGIHSDAIRTARAYDSSLVTTAPTFNDFISKYYNHPEVNKEFMNQKKGKVSAALINLINPDFSRAEAAHIASMITIKKKLEASNGAQPTT